MAGKFPTDVPFDKIIWIMWQDCVVKGVGACHVWNVRDENGVSDNIAVQVERFFFSTAFVREQQDYSVRCQRTSTCGHMSPNRKNGRKTMPAQRLC
jgi:hypothetical protein